MAAISSNGTGGGNWSTGASWSGGVAPVAGDTVTIASGDTILADTTGLACLSITLNGILSAVAGNTTDLTVGNGSSDTLITWGANGYLRYGTNATPLTGLHKIILSGINTSSSTALNNMNMASCNNVAGGISVVGSKTYSGVVESYTNPITGTVYATRRSFTTIATAVATAQANIVLTEDLNIPNGSIVMALGSHATTNGALSAGQNRTVSTYTAGTKTIVCTANITTAVALNAMTGYATTNARLYCQASSVTISASGSKYWGFTAPTSTNPIIDFQNATFLSCYGSDNSYSSLDAKVFQGCVFTSNSSTQPGGFRPANTPITYVSCVFDAFSAWSLTNQTFFNCLFCSPTRAADFLNVMTGSSFYDCVFQDAFQAVANSSGCYYYRCRFIQVNSAALGNGSYCEDCWFQGCGNCHFITGGRSIRPIIGRVNNQFGSNVNTYVEAPVILVSPSTGQYSQINQNGEGVGVEYAVAVQAPSGAGVTTTVGFKCSPGGILTGYTSGTVPDAVTTAPSGASIYNRLVTQAAIVPVAAGRSFRPERTKFQYNVTNGVSYAFTVNLRAISGYTASSLTLIKLRLTLPGVSTIETVVSSLPTNAWSPISVSGTAGGTGTATLEVYIQANIGNIYIDFPLDADPAGYRWTNGIPQLSQTRLADSSAGTIALAVWNSVPGTSSAGTRGAAQDNLLTEPTFVAWVGP